MSKERFAFLRKWLGTKSLLSEATSLNLTVLGLIFFISGLFLFLWNDTSFSLTSPIKSDKVAQFGDFIGGVVGSIWALAGVVLFYRALRLQQSEFALQRQEFKLQRTEFILTRITNIIYKQNELIDNQFNKESWSYNDTIGRQGFDEFLDEHDVFNRHVIFVDMSVDLQKRIKYRFDFLQQRPFADFINVVYSSISLVKGYIEDVAINEGKEEQFVLSEKNRELLYSLVNSTWTLDELYLYLRAASTVYQFHDQEHVYGGYNYDHIFKIRHQIYESWDFIKYVQRSVLRKAPPFAQKNSKVAFKDDHTYEIKV